MEKEEKENAVKMSITREAVLKMASNIASARTVGFIRIVLDQFKTVGEFLAADKGALMKAYNEARPGGKNGVGKLFFLTMDQLRREVVAARARAVAAAKETVVVQPIAAIPPVQPQPQMRAFSIEELKALVTVMELANLKSIDLMGIDSFFKAAHVDIVAATAEYRNSDGK